MPRPSREEDDLAPRLGHVVGAQGPGGHGQGREDQGQPEGAAPIAAAEADVAVGQEAADGHERDHHEHVEGLHPPLARGEREDLLALGAGPGVHGLEPHGPAPVGGGLHAQGDLGPARPGALPGGARVAVEGWRPPRLDRTEPRDVQPRLGEERRPVGRRGRPALALALRGHRVEGLQAALEVVLDARHVRDPRRRVAPSHDAGQRGLRERPRALAVPEGHDRRIAGGERRPASRGAVPLLGPEQVVAVLRETHLGVRDHRPRDEAGHEIAGPVLERLGALLDRDPREELSPALRRGQDQGAQHDDEEARPGRSRAQPLGLARRRHELRRRGLAGRDRGLRAGRGRRASRRRRGPRGAGASGPSPGRRRSFARPRGRGRGRAPRDRSASRRGACASAQQAPCPRRRGAP